MPNSNAILKSLSAGDAAALQPHLRPVHLESKRILFNIGDIIDSVYFRLVPWSSVLPPARRSKAQWSVKMAW
jgi:hypothetical protein